MGTLDGKVALVTGAGQGVGQGIAYALATDGAAVVVAGRTLAKVQATADEITSRGGRAHALECDVKDEADIQRCVDETVATFGTVDILVNNAQEVTLGPLLDMTRRQLPGRLALGPGRVVQLHEGVSRAPEGRRRRHQPRDVGELAPRPDGLRRVRRGEGRDAHPVARRRDGVGCRRHPRDLPHAARGVTRVPGLGAGRPRRRRALPRRHPAALRRATASRTSARAVAMLCGPDARYITGSTISVDGGQAYLR